MTREEFQERFICDVGDRCLISLAGKAGERRALRGSGPGWVIPRSAKELICLHESAHAVVAWVLKRHVYSASVEPRPDLKTKDGRSLGGLVTQGIEPGEPPPEHPDKPYTTDEENVQYWLELARDCFGVDESYVSALRERLVKKTELLVDAWWLHILALADRLAHETNLDEKAIVETLAPRKRRFETDESQVSAA